MNKKYQWRRAEDSTWHDGLPEDAKKLDEAPTNTSQPQLLLEDTQEPINELLLRRRRPRRPRRPYKRWHLNRSVDFGPTLKDMMQEGSLKDSHKLIEEAARAMVAGDEVSFEEKFAEALHSRLCSALLSISQHIGSQITEV